MRLQELSNEPKNGLVRALWAFSEPRRRLGPRRRRVTGGFDPLTGVDPSPCVTDAWDTPLTSLVSIRLTLINLG